MGKLRLRVFALRCRRGMWYHLRTMKTRFAAILLCAVASTGCVSNIADFRDTVAGAKQAVFPSLVYISVISESGSGGKIEKNQSSGSGVIVSEKGEVLTNHHVIDRATRIRCQLTDGSSYHAKIVGKDKDLDLALLQLEAPADAAFPAAELSNRTPDVGEVVLAMGAPWGLARSVSMGIISCNDRYLENCGDYTLWYQTDAAISPGNSGGPLVDTRGQVVGLNTRGNTRGAQGFTIPSPIILQVLPNLRKHGDAHWAWLGIDWQPLRDFGKEAFFDAPDGAIVAGTDPQSPARAAGLQPNDRVIAVDGRPVTARFREEIPALNRALALSDWDREIRLDYVRGSVTNSVSVKPRAKGETQGREAEFKRWGFTAKNINRFETPDLAFQAPDGGAYISSMAWEGNAEAAGLKQRDIIRKWDGKEIKSVADLEKIYKEAIAAIAKKTSARLDILRGGRPASIVIDYRTDPDKDE